MTPMITAALETASGASVAAGRYRPTVRDDAPKTATIDIIQNILLDSTPGTIIIKKVNQTKATVVMIDKVQNTPGRALELASPSGLSYTVRM